MFWRHREQRVAMFLLSSTMLGVMCCFLKYRSSMLRRKLSLDSRSRGALNSASTSREGPPYCSMNVWGTTMNPRSFNRRTVVMSRSRMGEKSTITSTLPFSRNPHSSAELPSTSVRSTAGYFRW